MLINKYSKTTSILRTSFSSTTFKLVPSFIVITHCFTHCAELLRLQLNASHPDETGSLQILISVSPYRAQIVVLDKLLLEGKFTELTLIVITLAISL